MDWTYGLFAWHDVCAYAGAAVCPCTAMHSVYSGLSAQRHTNTASDGCFACLLSCLLVAPATVCVDQFATRGLDTLADARAPAHAEEETEGNWFDYLLRAGHFGPARGAPEHWAHDGEGWDLPPDASEDWWPACWCGHYAWELAAATCACRAVGGDAPRMPLCFGCLVGALYPFGVCPLTLMLRRVVITRLQLRDEGYATTCAVAACCAPCALVQMEREVALTLPTMTAPPRMPPMMLAATRHPPSSAY